MRFPASARDGGPNADEIGAYALTWFADTLRRTPRECFMHLVDWLRRLPDMWILLIVLGSIVGMTVLAIRLRIPLVEAQGEVNSEAFDSFLSVASATAVLLAFSLVQADATVRATEDAVSKEAAAINSAHRLLFRYDDPRAAPALGGLKGYTAALIEDEWPRLERGGRSDKADRLYAEITRITRAVEPTSPRQQAMYAEALKYLDDIADLREQRINTANTSLPSLFWFATGLMIAFMILLAARMEPRVERLWTTGAISGVVAVLLFLVMVVDAPFHGESNSVSLDALRRTAQQLDKRNLLRSSRGRRGGEAHHVIALARAVFVALAAHPIRTARRAGRCR